MCETKTPHITLTFRITALCYYLQQQCRHCIRPIFASVPLQVLFALNQTLLQHEGVRAGSLQGSYTTEDLITHYNCGDLSSIIFNHDTSQVWCFSLRNTAKDKKKTFLKVKIEWNNLALFQPSAEIINSWLFKVSLIKPFRTQNEPPVHPNAKHLMNLLWLAKEHHIRNHLFYFPV